MEESGFFDNFSIIPADMTVTNDQYGVSRIDILNKKLGVADTCEVRASMQSEGWFIPQNSKITSLSRIFTAHITQSQSR